MKKALLTIAAIMLLTAPVSAQMASIWGDEAQTIGCMDNIFPYMEVPLYVFLDPGLEGATAFEYMMSTPQPGQYVTFGAVNAPVVSLVLGAYLDGPIAITFSCQTEPFWVVMIPLLMKPTATIQSGYVAIVDNPDVETIQIAICADPRPKRPCNVYNYFGWNAECLTGTKEASWGAIKSMF